MLIIKRALHGNIGNSCVLELPDGKFYSLLLTRYNPHVEVKDLHPLPYYHAVGNNAEEYKPLAYRMLKLQYGVCREDMD